MAVAHVEATLFEYLNVLGKQAPLGVWQKQFHHQTASYRAGQTNTATIIRSSVDAQVYALTRLPAIYAVVKRIVAEALLLQPIKPISVLDLGSGPGTVTWALQHLFPELKKVQWVERNRWLRAFGQQIATQMDIEIQVGAAELTGQNWLVQPADIVSLSYVLNELSPQEQLSVLIQAWHHTQQWLIVIEPGTPSGFSVIHLVRQHLLQMGAHVLAPCPHEQTCPMLDSDWCHFSQRLFRSKAHKSLKAGEKGHEDEKFSYIVASRQSTKYRPLGRILRHPMTRKGYLELQVCTAQGCQPLTVTRRNPAYKIARKLGWGDGWPPVNTQIE